MNDSLVERVYDFISTSNLRRQHGTGWLAAGVALALVALTLPGTAMAQDDGTTSFEVDPAHSNVLVRAQHLGAGFTFIEFNKMSGSVDFNKEEPSKSSVSLTVKTASVDTGVEKRDKHLKSPDFFHAKKFPEITFESTEVEKVDDNTYRVTGDLTIRDVTKSVTIDVKHTGTGKDQEGRKRHGFYTEFEVDRTEFNVDWKPDAGIVSKSMRLIISVEGVDK